MVNETLPALQQLKAQGLVRFIGITGLPLATLRTVLERAPPGEGCERAGRVVWCQPDQQQQYCSHRCDTLQQC